MSSLARNPFFWAFVVGCVMITSMRPLLRRIPAPPPVLRQVPPFTLTDISGRPFGSDQLRGHVYVASFFFTRCTSICPTLMSDLAKLQDRYRREGIDVRLVSITVDPEHDDPEELRTAAKRYGVDPSRWTVLTGPRTAIRDLAVGGFQVPIGDPEQSDAGMLDIAHTGKLLLVDAGGGLRGYYDTGELGLDEVFWRSKRVLDEKVG